MFCRIRALSTRQIWKFFLQNFFSKTANLKFSAQAQQQMRRLQMMMITILLMNVPDGLPHRLALLMMHRNRAYVKVPEVCQLSKTNLWFFSVESLLIFIKKCDNSPFAGNRPKDSPVVPPQIDCLSRLYVLRNLRCSITDLEPTTIDFLQVTLLSYLSPFPSLFPFA